MGLTYFENYGQNLQFIIVAVHFLPLVDPKLYSTADSLTLHAISKLKAVTLEDKI